MLVPVVVLVIVVAGHMADVVVMRLAAAAAGGKGAISSVVCCCWRYCCRNVRIVSRLGIGLLLWLLRARNALNGRRTADEHFAARPHGAAGMPEKWRRRLLGGAVVAGLLQMMMVVVVVVLIVLLMVLVVLMVVVMWTVQGLVVDVHVELVLRRLMLLRDIVVMIVVLVLADELCWMRDRFVFGRWQMEILVVSNDRRCRSNAANGAVMVLLLVGDQMFGLHDNAIRCSGTNVHMDRMAVVRLSVAIATTVVIIITAIR